LGEKEKDVIHLEAQSWRLLGQLIESSEWGNVEIDSDLSDLHRIAGLIQQNPEARIAHLICNWTEKISAPLFQDYSEV
jgi:hypothetical protein